jgi:hypothetical protein
MYAKEGGMSGALLTRLFGIFLVTWALTELPQTIYTTLQSYDSKWQGIVLLGVVPFIIPVLVGIAIAKWPRLLVGSAPEADDTGGEQLAATGLVLIGAFLFANGILDLVFQVSLGFFSLAGQTGFFKDAETTANTVASLVEVHLGLAMALAAKRLAARLLG